MLSVFDVVYNVPGSLSTAWVVVNSLLCVSWCPGVPHNQQM